MGCKYWVGAARILDQMLVFDFAINIKKNLKNRNKNQIRLRPI